MSRIYKVTTEAIDQGMNWDEVFAAGEIETVEVFDSYEDAVEAFDREGYDPDFYGVE